MSIISDAVAQIRSAIYGKDVRKAIADGIETLEAGKQDKGSYVQYSSQSLTEPQKTQARTNIGAQASGSYVQYSSQSLTESQKTQARTNIGAQASGSCVQYTSQSLTEPQKTQARTNIGAQVSGSYVQYTSQSLTESQKAQARTNIGVQASGSYVQYTPQSLTESQKAQARTNIGVQAGGSSVQSYPNRINKTTISELDFSDIVQAPSNVYYAFYTSKNSSNSITENEMANLPSYDYDFCSVVRFAPFDDSRFAMYIGLCANDATASNPDAYFAYGLGPSRITAWTKTENSTLDMIVKSHYNRINKNNVTDVDFSDIIHAKSNVYYAFYTSKSSANGITENEMANLPSYDYAYCSVIKFAPFDDNRFAMYLGICTNTSATSKPSFYFAYGLSASTMTPWVRMMNGGYEPSIKVSIIGDSISTFTGYIPSGYPSYYPNSYLQSVDATWWKRAIDELGCTFLKNASYSGGRVAGDDTQLQVASCDTRISNLSDGSTAPNIIICFNGTNDFAVSNQIGEWSSTSAVPTAHVINEFKPAYAKLLDKMHTAYPLAKIYCCTLPCRSLGTDSTIPVQNSNGDTLDDFNNAIRDVARQLSCSVIELSECGINQHNLSDYLINESGAYVHPKDTGHSMISKKVISVLGSQLLLGTDSIPSSETLSKNDVATVSETRSHLGI